MSDIYYEVTYTQRELLELGSDPYAAALLKAEDYARERGMVVLSRKDVENFGNTYILRYLLGYPSSVTTNNGATESPYLWDSLISDIRLLDDADEKEYGIRLQGFNGKDAIWEAYLSCLKQAVHLKQFLMEREARRVARIQQDNNKKGKK